MLGGRACTTLAATGCIVSGLLAGASCYSPPEPDCGFFCGSGGACPSDYTCGGDQRCHLIGSPEGECASEFAVASAQSTLTTTVVVTFTDAPDPVSAGDPANYAIPELSLSDALPLVAGNTVALTTTSQLAQLYTVQVGNVIRLSDGQPLEQGTASFAGRSSFNLVSGSATDANDIALVFDAPPSSAGLFDTNNYLVDLPDAGDVPVQDASLVGEMNVTLFVSPPTDGELAQVSVANLVRASDGEPLSNAQVLVLTRTPFAVVSAVAVDTQDVTVTFSDAPVAAQATQVANYLIDDVSGSGQLAALAPLVLNSPSVTLHTVAQRGILYQVTVSGVTRIDGEMLQFGENTATFQGIDHCADGVLDGNETDVDCGGPDCAPCASGKMCLFGSDCTSGTCTNGRCQ